MLLYCLTCRKNVELKTQELQIQKEKNHRFGQNLQCLTVKDQERKKLVDY